MLPATIAVPSASLGTRSLREAAENAQPLLGMSAGMRGHLSQPQSQSGLESVRRVPVARIRFISKLT
jgi:hypothetical protein